MTDAELAAAEKALRSDLDVVIDATNVHLGRWREVALRRGAILHVEQFDTDVDVCIERDRRRGDAGGRRVGDDVIRSVAERIAQANLRYAQGEQP